VTATREQAKSDTQRGEYESKEMAHTFYLPLAVPGLQNKRFFTVIASSA
jgi:hypothetical protein